MFEDRLNPSAKKLLEAPYPFKAVDESKENAQKKFGKDFIIDFGVGDPTDATPEIVRNACKKAVDWEMQSGYPVTGGTVELRETVAEWVKKRFGASLSPDEIVSTYGAKYACFVIPRLFIDAGKGEHCIVPNPGYPPYSSGTIIAGGVPHYYNLLPENGFEPDLQAIPQNAVKKSKVLFLNSPQSPTAKIYSKAKLKEAVDFCNDNKIVLVSDECYSDLYFAEPPHSVLEIRGSENCSVVLNSLSKRSMMTGYATGFLASKNPVLLGAFKRIQDKSVQGVATFIQSASAVAFADERHPAEMRKIYKGRLDALVPALKGIGCDFMLPEGTFFLWAKIPERFSSPRKFCEWLLIEKGINSVPGNLISETVGGVNPGSDRARFALVPNIDGVREAAKRLSE